MMWEYDMGWGWGVGMILFWLVPILLIAMALKYLFAGKNRIDSGLREGNSRALAILDGKYARGEISREAFLEKRDDLKRS